MRRVAFVLAVVVSCFVPALADQTVVFTSGLTLRVRSWRADGALLHLEFANGGTITIDRALLMLPEEAALQRVAEIPPASKSRASRADTRPQPVPARSVAPRLPAAPRPARPTPTPARLPSSR